jgi:hypothetical protein
MGRKLIAIMVIITVVLIVHFFVIPIDRLFMLVLAERANCLPGDTECLQQVKALRSECDPPSVSVVTVGNETNNLTIQTTTYMKDGKCVTEEIVLEDANSGVAPFDITGYNTTCEIEEERFEQFGQKACNGSISSFTSPDRGSFQLREYMRGF